MTTTLRSVLSLRPRTAPLAGRTPVREELFGIERLEQHARSLAEAQTATRQPRRVPSLHARLEDNARVLLAAYRTSARELESGRGTVPAEAWLLDNYHLVEEQVSEARNDLPVKFYRQLPKLESGPFAGYPRVFGIAWAYVAHTDSHFDPDILRRFLTAYQTVQPLTIGELWAVAITLRIVLIENLRRLSDQITVARDERAEAEALADQLAKSGDAHAVLDARISSHADGIVPEIFAAQLARRLRDLDPIRTPALTWLEERLARQGVSVDLVVQHSHQRQAASNVTVRNIITSMRLMSAIGWSDLFEQVSLVDARLREGSAFAEMDFPSRNLYRSAIEQLARHSPYSESEVAVRALVAGREAEARTVDAIEAHRVGDPGYHLIGQGRPAFEETLSFVPPARLRLKRFSVGRGLGGYVLSILLVTAALLVAAGWSLEPMTAALAGFLALAFLPFTEAATALVNRLVASHVEAVSLLGLELLDGVPDALRTLVVIPTLLTSRVDLREEIERLEVHHLSGGGGELYFALLTDWVDSETESRDDDLPLLALAADEIATLNARHDGGRAGPRFHLAHRRRVWSDGEGRWMGWERKRGKLQELNRLLRGASDTTYLAQIPGGDGRVARLPVDVRYVLTLDGDTRLPRDAAIRLIGKMAHPINRPRFDAHLQRVVDGYAILQPRVTPSLPMGRSGSLYQRVFSGPSGLDPYAAAASNVYQDLLGEGSFTGKGIYEIDAFEASLAGRVPDNTLLSHDLFEGIFARAGLASDVEVIDEFPSRYEVDAKRSHRWIRGDWQLAPWIFGHLSGPRATPAVGRWKMLDNLRRSLIAPSLFAAFAVCTALPPAAARLAVLMLLASFAIPIFMSALYGLLRRPPRVSLGSHLARSWSDIRLAFDQWLLSLAFLPDRAWRALDAVVRTLVRMFATHRHLLEWTTAAQSARSRRLDAVGYYRAMVGGTTVVAIGTVAGLALHPWSWPFVVPLAALWVAAPLGAMWVSRPRIVGPEQTLSVDEARELRLIARKTWRFFETFVTPADNHLPPDNFQEVPKPVVARRTSPTNIGLYFLSTIAARDFGWTGTTAAVERCEATLATMRKLAKFSGHFFNWYGTEDLRALEPPYVSAVDSGNLAGHLIVLANACESWREDVVCEQATSGLGDALLLVREAVRACTNIDAGLADQFASAIDTVELRLAEARTTDANDEAVQGAVDRLAMIVERVAATAATPAATDDDTAAIGPADLVFWTAALGQAAREHAADRRLAGDALTALEARLTAIAREARGVAMLMDFAFLLDPERKLLSIGYSQNDNRLDANCYDLLASEARLASLFAIAKGDVPTKHWFRLGRSATPVGNESALVSWSGSMFEYLMPSLVMRAPFGSLLEQTNRLIVARQQGYGASLDIPWGVSESAYNARDLDFTYQYSNFGVPGLGFKRGLGDNVVIAPYATGLATMVDPRGALANFRRLAALGGSGRYGFHDALDFTRSRLPEGQTVAVVRNFMAHHEGMTIVAIANTLRDGRMRRLFHSEPMIVASELLLQERMPRDVADEPAQAEERRMPDAGVATEGATQRVVPALTGGAPVTHLLSNGRYAVMLTASGSGYSRWRDIAVTRWREDPTRDADGSFVYLRDVQSEQVWATTTQPFGNNAPNAEAIFAEDHATFTRRDGSLRTTMEIVVSAEDDAEVRRISLTNSGRRPREIELTSYAEIVLTTPSTDNAHPAFAKMFVQTRHLPTFDALVATRRKRTPSEPDVWVAHFAVIEGERTESAQYETDRLRFLGRGRHPGTAAAMSDGRRLSNTVGTVLDPIFALRHRVRVPPGGVARVAFWTVVAASEAELMDLVDRHHDRSAFDRARTFAWTQAQVALRHIGIQADESSDFQRLAAPLLYADARFRMPSEAIRRGMGPQSNLWSQSISGDLPIVVLRIDDIDDIAQVRQLLRAHEYWRMKRLDVDLVILNERASSYVQDLQIAIETAQRSSLARPSLADAATSARGSVYALRADLVPPEAQSLLLAVARVVLVARRGALAQQLAHLPRSSVLLTKTRRVETLPPVTLPGAHPVIAGLEFFNGFGGFAKDGREYVVVLDGARMTPAPWINVVANAGFGFLTSADGSGFTWAENSRDNQLTPWSNDPVGDPSGEALYVRDESTGDVWTATALPIRAGGSYIARHGHGYSRFEHESNEIALEQLQYVPIDDPIKITRLTLRNRSTRTRRLSVTSYVEWVLGTSRASSTPALTTEIDQASGAIFVRNAWGTAFPGRVAFADLDGQQSAWTTDRTEFLGRNGRASAPAGLAGKAALSGTVGAGMDICTALQTVVELAPGATVEVVAFIGQCASDVEARALVARYRAVDLDRVLAEATRQWDQRLDAVQVRTPNRAMDILLNGWLLYQTMACRILARSAFYQASGAYGFRDQLQDGMALTFAMPGQTRTHLLRSAGRQFAEGDVQHWWLPHSGQGVRTHISDDRVWLAYATATYVSTSGDAAILDEPLAWLEGPALKPGEHDAFFKPMQSDDTATLFEHCARGLDQCIALTGEHGLPLMGTGDWNDGMNRVGQDGRGESVWLAWLLLRTIYLFAPHAERRDAGRQERWLAHAVRVRESIDRDAWDGEWFRRATFDDGTWMGSKDSEECRIDSIAQSWAVLSGLDDPAHAERAATAMASVDRHLVRNDESLALLFTPPFDTTHHDPGYIKGYPPGLRENGGQYSHAAMWLIFAFAKLGQLDRAVGIFSLLNPINHALTRSAADTYKVEPYVVAADVYSVAPHVGRGGWTWYTGSAAWMYRAGIEGILGITREGAALVLAPHLPGDWPGFEATIEFEGSRYEIAVERSGDATAVATLDDVTLDATDGRYRLPLDGERHVVRVRVSEPATRPG